jgi:excisionase family DNA binding protein
MKQLASLPRAALRKSEAARILGISVPLLNQLIAQKRLRAFQPTPTCVRILWTDLEAFIAQTATAPLANASPTLAFCLLKGEPRC